MGNGSTAPHAAAGDTEALDFAGATIGLGGRADQDGIAKELGRFAYLCGTAFQMQDDILGLTADESLLGKPVGSDLREGKRTLVLYRALANASPAARARLLSVVGRADAGPEDIRSALGVIEETNAVEQISQVANQYVNRALEHLSHVPQTRYRDLLEQLAKFVLARRH